MFSVSEEDESDVHQKGNGDGSVMPALQGWLRVRTGGVSAAGGRYMVTSGLNMT